MAGAGCVWGKLRNDGWLLQVTDGDATEAEAVEDTAAVGAAGALGEQYGVGHGVDGAVAEAVVG